MRLGDEPVRIPGTARMLGYGGVLPFAAMVLNQVMVGPLSADFALKVFVCYSAAILSFLGGIRWGAATNLQTAMGRELVIAVVPSLWAVMCLLAISVELSIWGLLSRFRIDGCCRCALARPGNSAVDGELAHSVDYCRCALPLCAGHDDGRLVVRG